MLKVWDENVLNLFADFADGELQLRSWFGIGPEVSSPEEMYCQIDDFLVAEWLEANKVDISSFLHIYITDFLQELDDLPNDLGPWDTYTSPEWQKITLKARVIEARLKFELASRGKFKSKHPESL